MSLVHLTEENLTRVREIDEEHDSLAAILNSLHDSVLAGESDATVGPALEGLIEELKQHFATENDLMERFGYPGREPHLQEHRIYLERLRDLQAVLAREHDPATVAEAFFLLQDWFIVHTRRDDRALGEFLNAQGYEGRETTAEGTAG